MRQAQGLRGFFPGDLSPHRFNAASRQLAGFTKKFVLTLLVVSGLVVRPALAATNSNKVDVALQANVAEALTIVVANPAIVFGLVTPGANNAAPAGQALAITSTWLLSAGETVKLYAYFDTASSALTGTVRGDLIPTSAVTASFNSGTAQTFTQTSPFTASATAISLYSVAITGANAVTAARIDSLALSLNLAGVTLHPDIYIGTMHLQAQAL